MNDRVVDEEMVREAVAKAWEAAIKKAPEAKPEELLEGIGPTLIYNVWMPFLFDKKGSYGKQVAPMVKKIKSEMLTTFEQARQTIAAPVNPLRQRLAAECDQLQETINGNLTVFRESLAVADEANYIESGRETEAKVAAGTSDAERRAKIAENESSEHLEAIAVFERDRDVAIDRADQLAAEHAETKEQLCGVYVRANLLAEQLSIASARAEEATAAAADAYNATTTLKEQLNSAVTRGNRSDLDKDLFREEARKERERAEMAITAAAMLEEKLKAAIARTDQAESDRNTARNEASNEREWANKAITAEAETRTAASVLEEKLKAAVAKSTMSANDRDAANIDAKSERERADLATAAKAVATAAAASLVEQLKAAKAEIANLKDRHKIVKKQVKVLDAK